MSPDTKVDDINDAFRERILRGEFGTAGRLPSLRMLAEEFGTTHETMNKVIQRLQAEGLLISRGRAGVFVQSRHARIPGITSRFDLFLQQEMGLTPVETNIDEPSIVDAPPEVARALGVTEGTPVVQRSRRQGTTGIHYRLAKNFYPLELVGEEVLERIKQDVHFDVLEAIREKHHQVIKRVHEDVYARLPTSEERELLKIVRNAPVLEVFRTSYSEKEGGIPIMFSHIIFVASAFVLSYDYPVYYWSS
jgi:DNA-binding GntR family transcriptional regulator